MRHELDVAKLKIKQLQEQGQGAEFQGPSMAAIARNPGESGQCWAVPYINSRCSPIDQPCNSTGSLLREKHRGHEGGSRGFPVVEIETVL